VRLTPRSARNETDKDVFGETPNTATGTVALPKICVHSRPFAVAICLLPADVFILHHGDDFTPVRERQKTYRRLFGMIFFEGSLSMVVPALQWLATLKILKNRKKWKAKCHFYFAKHRFFCQNALKKACFFCQY
jgi:hypothetical protein